MTARTPLRDASSYVCPSRPNPVTSVTALGSNGRMASAAARFSSIMRVDGCLERARGRDSVPLCLQHEAGTERLREEEDVARARPGLRPDPLRMHQADDREPVLRLGVANRVAARENRAGGTNALVGAGEHLAEHLDREAPPERR